MAVQQKIDWDGIFKGIDSDFSVSKPTRKPTHPKPLITLVERITPELNLTIQSRRESLETVKTLPYHTKAEWESLKTEAQKRLPQRHQRKNLNRTTILWILEPVDTGIADWTPASVHRVGQTLGGLIDLDWSPDMGIPEGVDDIEQWATNYVTEHSNALEIRNRHGHVIFKAVGRSSSLNPI